jgi:hypothetical protein
MHERPFPFWTSDKSITYTELQEFCKAEYDARGPQLIERVKQNLERYRQAADRQEALKILLSLDEDSLTLSCFNALWCDFSVAVFEVFVLPSKQSIPWAAQYLNEILNSTLRRLEHGNTASQSS